MVLNPGRARYLLAATLLDLIGSGQHEQARDLWLKR